MKRMLLTVLILISGAAVQGMEQNVEGLPEIDMKDTEGRFISIDNLFSQVIKEVPAEYKEKVADWKIGLEKLTVENYNKKIAQAIKRGPEAHHALENIVLALQAINENMNESQVVQEAAFAQQVKSAETARKQLTVAIVSTCLAGCAFGVSLLFNILQATEESV